MTALNVDCRLKYKAMATAATAKERKVAAKRDKGKDGFPKYIVTLRTLCACYMRCWREYHVKVVPQMIIHWQAGRRLGPGEKPWHPIYDDKNRYNWAECKAWFEAVILPKYKYQLETAASAAAQRELIPIEDLEDAEKRKEFEHREWERAKERGEFISRSAALATGIAAIKKLNLMLRSEDEQQLPNKRREKLTEILKTENIGADVATKICEEFMVWDIELGKSITDRRETMMANAAKFKSEEST